MVSKGWKKIVCVCMCVCVLLRKRRRELTENRQTHDYIRSADQEGEADLQEIDDVPEDAGYYAVGAGQAL